MGQTFSDNREADQRKDISSKIIFFMPFLMILIGIIAYMCIPFDLYDTDKLFEDGLFTDLQNIIDAVCNQEAVLPQIQKISSIRIFWDIWLTGFIASLFFVGRQLHKKPQPDKNAVLVKKEPYLKIQEVNNVLKQLQRQHEDEALKDLLRSVKRLEEKFFAESDFGYGDSAVIACENNIAKQLQFLADTVSNMETEHMTESVEVVDSVVFDVDALLRRRMELKRR